MSETTKGHTPAKKTAPLLSAYAAIGDDAKKRSFVIERLEARLATEGDMSMNVTQHVAGVASGEDIVADCSVVPFMSGSRLVVVQNAGSFEKPDSEAIVRYLADPNPSTILLLVAEKLAKNTRLYKAVEKIGKEAIIDCSLPTKGNVARLVRTMAEEKGVALDAQGVAALVDLVGQDTVRLDAELEKMATLLGSGAKVGKDAVDGLVARSAEVKPWDFLDAIGRRDRRECFALLAKMPSANPFGLIALIEGRIEELICARCLVDRGAARSIARELGKQDWQVKHHASFARNFTLAELEGALVRLRNAEYALKTGADPDETILRWIDETL